MFFSPLHSAKAREEEEKFESFSEAREVLRFKPVPKRAKPKLEELPRHVAMMLLLLLLSLLVLPSDLHRIRMANSII